MAILAFVGGSAAVITSLTSVARPTQNYRSALNSGIAAQRLGLYTEAILDYQAALIDQPGNPTVLFDLGDAEQFAGNATAARHYYLACLRVAPHDVAALYNLGVLESRSQPSAAMADYRRIIATIPVSITTVLLVAKSHFNLGYLLLARGQRAAGLAEIHRGIALDPALQRRFKG